MAGGPLRVAETFQIFEVKSTFINIKRLLAFELILFQMYRTYDYVTCDDAIILMADTTIYAFKISQVFFF